MKPSDLIKHAMEEGNIPNTVGAISQWIVEKKGKAFVTEIVQSINDDEILRLTPKGKAQNKLFITKLHYWDLFDGVAIKYSQEGLYEESEIIFNEILKRTPNDPDVLGDFGAVIADRIQKQYKRGKPIAENQLRKACALIFKSYGFAMKSRQDWYVHPAYKNLSLLRALEAIFHFNKGELFVAFILGWMSIEMSLYRIWFQFISDREARKKDELMKWNADSIIAALYLGNVHEAFRDIRDDLDVLKGVRHKLIHGRLEVPTIGISRRCIETAWKIKDVLAQ